MPTIVALPFSCNAAANISAALAVPPLERMATGTVNCKGKGGESVSTSTGKWKYKRYVNVYACVHSNSGRESNG